MAKVKVAKESQLGWAKDVNLAKQKVKINKVSGSTTDKGKEKNIEVLFATDSKGNEILLSNSMFNAEVRNKLKISVDSDGTFELNEVEIAIEAGKILV